VSGSATIDELLDALIDYRGKTPPKTAEGIPLITAKVIKNGRITSDRQEFIAEDYYDTWMRRGLPRTGDVLITTEAPLGEVAQVGRNAHIALAQRVILLRPDIEKVDPQFFFHFLRSPQAQERLRRRSSGTTVSGIRQPELRAVEVDLLPRRSQEIVGSVLDALDQMIENNRRRIEVLEEMAQAIYREWFVHFRYPGHDDATFVDSPLGPIPEGWALGRLSDIAEVTRSTIHPRRTPSTRFEHYSLPAFDEAKRPADEPGREIRSGKYEIPNACVLLSKLNPRIPRVWYVDRTHDSKPVASTEFLVLTPRADSNLDLIYLTTTDSGFLDRLQSLTGGTSGSHQRARPGDVMELAAIVPSTNLREFISTEVGPLLSLSRTLNEAIASLARTRDLLLPKLVTGEIDVSDLDLDALVEAAS